MVVADISNIPKIGEEIIVPNNVTWEPEVLKCVWLQEDQVSAKMMGLPQVIHVYFESPEPQDNIQVLPNGVKYYTIRTYA